jgi:Flp pilus assembly protein TadG
MRCLSKLRTRTEGSALLEFAIVLPLLVVFIVGIYDFSGAFNQKQKISHAAQEGAVVAGAQPMTDMDPTSPANSDPDSLHPVLEVVFSSLAANNVLPAVNWSGCSVASAHVAGLQWRYTITVCTPDPLTIEIDRGVVADPGPPASIRTTVKVSYPYHWRFNSVIQLLVPGALYAATTDLSETASVHNQM